MPRIDLSHDGELFEPVQTPVRQIMAAHPTKRKSRLWRYATFLLLPLTSFVGVEVALFVAGPLVAIVLIALFSFSPM